MASTDTSALVITVIRSVAELIVVIVVVGVAFKPGCPDQSIQHLVLLIIPRSQRLILTTRSIVGHMGGRNASLRFFAHQVAPFLGSRTPKFVTKFREALNVACAVGDDVFRKRPFVEDLI
ncbi:hypothetical protein AA0119_g13633 [Alternaria tenuissima]|uniref:Uncharacterized protein n=1 Tax=Alternaria tenuissima TaxID=119927 RepID=A0ABY0FN46_9PLEO|nr:hypothetical protein AA0119_g13633 [Alternaria tenuissima]